MKSNYVVRARKLMNDFVPYMRKYRIDIAVDKFNTDKHRNIELYGGIARRVLVTSDYAVKWDYNYKAIHSYGGCKNEYALYQEVKNGLYSYLFAEVTKIEVRGRVFYVMPRIDCLAVHFDADASTDIESYLDEDEYEYIQSMGIRDLHDENWGMLHGVPTIIDYACT